jgi:hypothetical protein
MDVALLVALVIAVSSAGLLLARRDLAAAGFLGFFLLYSAIALAGYRFAPLVSMAQGLYFGPGVFRPALTFVAASFAAVLVGLRVSRGVGRVVDRGVERSPHGLRFGVFTLGAIVLAIVMAIRLSMIYRDIEYGRIPQIPDKLYSVVFKNLPALLVVVWAVGRSPGRSRFEQLLTAAAFAALGAVFVLTAVKSGNRTDILSVTLGIVMLEVGMAWMAATGVIRIPSLGRVARTAGGAALGLCGMLALAAFVQRNRVISDVATLPLEYRVFFNDYYSPAHMLFASMAMDYVHPWTVVKSNLANSFLLGGALGVPYLQQDLGNIIAPGSSSRSTGFAFFIFAEGFIAAGWGGILYNGMLITFGLALWRRQARTTDLHYNAVVLAITAMQWAVVSRSGTHLLVRNYLLILLPMLWLYRQASGCRLVPTLRGA